MGNGSVLMKHGVCSGEQRFPRVTLTILNVPKSAVRASHNEGFSTSRTWGSLIAFITVLAT